ncbi:putative binding protein BAB2_0491 [Saccostrea echinata]|uniref:putative binding protein BAB2_0491 n=1 Tax=Saccostrea echinata TaxID=191078 RepID=UPI002A83BD7C|nr:putative binding protein BAB2_0491 [Saccostrea echinata]
MEVRVMNKISLLMILFLLVLQSCKGSDKKNIQDAAVSLTVWHYFAEQDVDVFNEGIQKYARQKDIEVTSTFVERRDLLKQYTMGALSGRLPDVGLVDNPDHASFAVMGIFQDITDLVEATGEKDFFFKGPLLSATYEGKLYGLPHNSNALALFINNAMFREKNLEAPTTWDELLVVCEKLADKEKGVYPLAMSAVNTEEGTFQFMPWLLSAGGGIEDLGGENSIRAVKFLKTLIDKGYMSIDVINWGQGSANTQFMNGLAAMQVNGPWNIPTIQQEAPDLDFSVVLLPKDQKYASVLGGENFAVLSGAPREEAFDLLYFITSKEVVADYAARAGKFPSRSDALELKTIWTEDPLLKVFGEELKFALPRGPHPRWPEISSIIIGAVTEVLTGVKTAEESMQEAAAKYDEIIR